MADAWNMQSNIKAKPGSQGTLFQVADKSVLNPQQRWPRGYTPERQAEVNEIMHGANSPYLLSDKAGTGPARRDLNETIKRSTVPAEHLGGVKFHPGQASLESYNGDRYGEVHGVYRDERQGVKPEISILKGQENTFVPIHEIGHHVSANEATGHSEYKTGYQQGQEEGFADRYAFKHFRDRKGNPLETLRQYPSPAGDQQRALNFSSAYHVARAHIPAHDPFSFNNLTPQQRAFRGNKEAESAGETLFRTWDNGDGRVDFTGHPETPYGSREQIGWTRKGPSPR